ncbi:hypothetical protein LTR67_006435 [Exophiala xenobiotica]
MWKVVITTPQTLAHRHGPQAVIKYRQERFRLSYEAAKQRRHILPEDWEYNQSGLFDVCAIDEAQSIKNPASSSHYAYFYALVTASPRTLSIWQ